MQAAPEWSDLSQDVRTRASAAKSAVLDDRDVFLIGPPGCGKTMVARRLQRNLKKIDAMGSDMAFVYRLHGTGMPCPTALSQPFRAPHHTVSSPAMIGGGAFMRPGECSLSHGGILFLDEVTEFNRTVLDTVSRVHRDKIVDFGDRYRWVKTLPADFVLVVAYSPCPCGFYGTDRNLSRLDRLELNNPITVDLSK